MRSITVASAHQQNEAYVISEGSDEFVHICSLTSLPAYTHTTLAIGDTLKFRLVCAYAQSLLIHTNRS